jgi:phosphorylcholine metabolism protein LicD
MDLDAFTKKKKVLEQIMSKNIILVIIYHRHKCLDLIWNKEIGTFYAKTFWMEHSLPRCKCSKTANII